MSLSQKEMIDLFSEDPKNFHEPPRQYSNLYLLRRDIGACLGTDLVTKEPNRTPAAQWPGAMAILAFAGSADNMHMVVAVADSDLIR